MARVIGIDLGTTNSCVAAVSGGEVEILPNSEGDRTTPSVVGFDQRAREFVGGAAKRQAISNPGLTVSSVKRLMGRTYDEVKNLGFKQRLGSDEQGLARVVIGGKLVTPEQISSRILSKLRSDAAEFLSDDVSDVVVTVPAYFNNTQREATKRSAELAGFHVMRIINEPTAAALA